MHRLSPERHHRACVSLMYYQGLTPAFAATMLGHAAAEQESVHNQMPIGLTIYPVATFWSEGFSPVVESLHAERCTRTCQGHDDVREVHATHEAPAAPADPATEPVWDAWA